MPLTEWLRLQLAMLQLHILGLWPDVDPCLWGWCWPLWGGPQCYVWPVRSPMMLPVWPSPGSPPRHLSRFEWRSQITAPSLLWHPSHSPLFPLSCRPITFSPLLQNCFNFGAECWVTPTLVADLWFKPLPANIHKPDNHQCHHYFGPNNLGATVWSSSLPIFKILIRAC